MYKVGMMVTDLSDHQKINYQVIYIPIISRSGGYYRKYFCRKKNWI